MSFKDKIEQIARDITNETYRDLTAIRSAQQQGQPVLAKVLSIDGNNQYTVVLASGETMSVFGGGMKPLAFGETYHLIGDTIS